MYKPIPADTEEIDCILSTKGWLSQSETGAFIFNPICESSLATQPPLAAVIGTLRSFVHAGLLPSHNTDTRGNTP